MCLANLPWWPPVTARSGQAPNLLAPMFFRQPPPLLFSCRWLWQSTVVKRFALLPRRKDFRTAARRPRYPWQQASFAGAFWKNCSMSFCDVVESFTVDSFFTQAYVDEELLVYEAYRHEPNGSRQNNCLRVRFKKVRLKKFFIVFQMLSAVRGLNVCRKDFFTMATFCWLFRVTWRRCCRRFKEMK